MPKPTVLVPTDVHQIQARLEVAFGFQRVVILILIIDWKHLDAVKQLVEFQHGIRICRSIGLYLIEDYLLRENGSAGKFAINALSGSFRFVTGGAPKDRYVITTPTGTIGVRGTAFDLWVGGSAFYQLLYHGSTINCPPGVPLGDPRCVIATDTCDLVQVSSNLAELLGHADNVTGQARNQLRAWFLWAVSQNPLLRQFRIQNAERCVNRPAGGGGPPSLSTPPSGGNQPPQQGGGDDNGPIVIDGFITP